MLFALLLEFKGLLKARRMRLLRGCLSRKSGIKLKGFPSFQISPSCLCTGIRLRCKFFLLQHNLSLITPCPHVSGYFRIGNFFFAAGFGFRPHLSGESGRRIRNVLNPLARVKLFWIRYMNLETCISNKNKTHTYNSSAMLVSCFMLLSKKLICTDNEK